MKLTVIPILIVLLITQVFSKWVIVLEFNLNQEFISKTLCINKEKPQLKCKGKCQLAKELGAEENSNENESTLKLVFPDTYIESTTSIVHFEPIVLKSKNHSFYKPLNSIVFSTSVFHPPTG